MFSRRKELLGNSKSVSQNPHEFSQLVRKLSSRYYTGWQQHQMSWTSQAPWEKYSPRAQSATNKTHKILYMAEPHPYSICRRKEPQNYTFARGQVEPEGNCTTAPCCKPGASYTPFANEGGQVCSASGSSEGFSPQLSLNGASIALCARDGHCTHLSTMLQTARTGEHRDFNLRCCKI